MPPALAGRAGRAAPALGTALGTALGMRVLANGEAPNRASGVEAGEGALDEAAAEGDGAEGEGGGSPGRGVELRSRSWAAGGVRWAYKALWSSGKVEADTVCAKRERIGRHQWSSMVISGH